MIMHKNKRSESIESVGSLSPLSLLRRLKEPKELNRLFQILSLGFFLVLNGCAAVLIGGAAVGTIVVAQGFAVTTIDASYQDAWKASSDQMKAVGKITKTLEKLGEIKGMVEGHKVRIKITKLTERTLDIKVSAHKHLLPNTDLAQEILSGIMDRL